eukprot:5122145-Pleurochrysis_carterae.AAC.1
MPFRALNCERPPPTSYVRMQARSRAADVHANGSDPSIGPMRLFTRQLLEPPLSCISRRSARQRLPPLGVRPLGGRAGAWPSAVPLRLRQRARAAVRGADCAPAHSRRVHARLARRGGARVGA